MGKSLVIVESPAKAKTINKYLGSDYIVKSSVGHVRDLPTSGSGKPVDPKARAAEAAKTRKMGPKQKIAHKAKKAKTQLVARMGIDPEKGWKPNYQILPNKDKVVNELRQLAKNADSVVLATDLDREGEAIAWHLKEIIGGDDDRFQRVVFNEITKKAIQKAFERLATAHHPHNLYNQQFNNHPLIILLCCCRSDFCTVLKINMMMTVFLPSFQPITEAELRFPRKPSTLKPRYTMYLILLFSFKLN